MTQQEISDLKKIIAQMFAYYRQPIDQVVVGMYASDLAHLDFRQVFSAYEKYRRDPKNKFMPLPAHIQEMIQGPSDTSDITKAKEAAARVIGAVGKFGHTRGQEAREYIGELGWQALTTRYSWSYFCEQLGAVITPTTVESQLREHCVALIEQARAGKLNQPPALPEPRKDPPPQLSGLIKGMIKEIPQ